MSVSEAPDPRDSRVALRLLGSAEIHLDGRPVAGLASDKVVALLAYLALRPGPRDRDLLADLLWGEMPAKRARASLRTALYSAQQALPGVLAVSRKTAGWDPDRAPWVDVVDFLQATEATDVERAELARAAGLWRGELLEGLRFEGASAFESWVADQRADLGLRRIAALERLAEAARQAGDGPGAELWLRRLLQAEPWHEAGHRRLMRQLARRGDLAAALKQFADCRAALWDALEVEPERSTLVLARRIEAARERGVRTRPPEPPDALIGRETALARLEGLLLDSSVRLVSLVGPGGVGKTRLALEAARALAYATIDGVRFVPLAGAEDEAAFQGRLAGALGLDLHPGRPAQRQLLDHLRDQELLLVLDNMEQLVDEADFVRVLLEAAPDVTLLLTSRVRLDLDREVLFPLDGLESPASAAGSEERLATYPAVRLFLREARKVRPEYSLALEGEAVAAICRRLGGLPLGIRLAAALVDLEPATALARSLSRDLDPLATTRRDVPERHQSLRIVFEHSWKLLGEAERAALLQLSLFQDPFSASDAAAVTGAGASVLRGLLGKSVIQRLSAPSTGDDPASGEPDGPAPLVAPRFRVHASVRHFAAERLAAEPAMAAEARQRYQTHVLTLLERQGRALHGPGMAAARQVLEACLDDLHHGWRSAVAEADVAFLERGLEGFVRVHELRGMSDAALALVARASAVAEGQARAAPPGSPASRLPLRLLVALARLAVSRADYDDAVRWAEQALTRLENGADVAAEVGTETWRIEQGAAARSVLGQALWRMGNYERAGAVLAQAQAQLDALGPAATRRLRRSVRGAMGTVARYLGHFEEADRHGRAALREARAEGDPLAEALAHLALGVYAHEAGRFGEARSAGEEALRAFRALGHRRGVGNALNNLANVHADMGDHVRSAGLIREALAIFRGLGDRWGEAMALNNLGMELLDGGDPGAALSRFEEAVRLMGHIGNRQGVAMATNNLGVASAAVGEYERACVAYEEALATYGDIGDRRGVVLARCDLADALRERDPVAAIDHAEAALAGARVMGDAPSLARAWYVLGGARLAVGEGEAALAAFEEALRARRDLEQAEAILLARSGRAEARLATGDSAGAVADAWAVVRALGAGELGDWGDPFTPALAAWRVLGAVDGLAPSATDRARLEDLIEAAKALLEERAQRLTDARRRRGFLEGVAVHRGLRAVTVAGERKGGEPSA